MKQAKISLCKHFNKKIPYLKNFALKLFKIASFSQNLLETLMIPLSNLAKIYYKFLFSGR